MSIYTTPSVVLTINYFPNSNVMHCLSRSVTLSVSRTKKINSEIGIAYIARQIWCGRYIWTHIEEYNSKKQIARIFCIYFLPWECGLKFFFCFFFLKFLLSFLKLPQLRRFCKFLWFIHLGVAALSLSFPERFC